MTLQHGASSLTRTAVSVGRRPILLLLDQRDASRAWATRAASVSASRNPSSAARHDGRWPRISEVGTQVACAPAIDSSSMTSIGRPVGDDLTVPEQQDTVCVRQCKVHVVRDEVDALEAGDRHDLAHERLGGAVILPGRRLVQDQRRRLEGQGDGQGEPFLLAEREGQRRPLEDVLELIERGPRAGSRRSSSSKVPASRPRFRGPEERAPRGPSGRRASGWGSGRRSRRSVASSEVVRRSAGPAPSTRIVAAVDRQQRIAVRKSGRLARAVRAEDGHDLAPPEAARRSPCSTLVVADAGVDRRGTRGAAARLRAATGGGLRGGAGAVGRRSDGPARRGPARGRPRTAA